MHVQANELNQHTQLHKVVVLQNVLGPVPRTEEFPTGVSPHAELHVPACVLTPLGLMVPLQGITAQRVDGGRRAAAGHPEPSPLMRTDTQRIVLTDLQRAPQALKPQF